MTFRAQRKEKKRCFSIRRGEKGELVGGGGGERREKDGDVCPALFSTLHVPSPGPGSKAQRLEALFFWPDSTCL